ncbi:L-histidine N(alpha)-methyltransferase [Marinihelvus fidelis]|uniref:L-histidine N(alpha)-methyltransferase n=1 Tax=Marinihelvus fidelis TaxID=2613842 RepID=UPI001784A42A|nr:L-histidine N(alpha)-methyltransferase [Marinihelvus fidelis]
MNDSDVLNDSAFARDVLAGLSATPKRLMSRYFYDERGDELFQAIMASPEYYLTDCELEILREQGEPMATAMATDEPFELVELGSGDGSKIRYLLDALQANGADFSYRPVDISAAVLDQLAGRLRPGRPWLELRPMAVNYMAWLEDLVPGEQRRVFAFMGSNLGNFGDEGAVGFLSLLRRAMGPRDALLIGLDLKKDPAIIRAAYNDAAGVTAAFNLNLLARINHELGGEFDPAGFEHAPEYDPATGAARSWLRSLRDQRVPIAALERDFTFAQGERVFMEISQKYDDAMIADLSTRSGFRVAADFRDRRGWFTDQLWVPLTGDRGSTLKNGPPAG